jgi:hypothetical protein
MNMLVVGVSKILWLFDEFVEFQRSRYSSNEYHNKCVECV